MMKAALDPAYMVGEKMQPLEVEGSPNIYFSISSWTQEDGLVHAQAIASEKADFCGWWLGRGEGRTVREAHMRARRDAAANLIARAT